MRKKKVDYFEFLYQTGFDDYEHRQLAGYLHTISFDWTNTMDENRMYDGIEMRREYGDVNCMNDIFDQGCSMLEFFVGFAWRLARDMFSDISCPELVKAMLRNLELWEIDDEYFENEEEEDVTDEIDESLDIWVNCEYNRHGEGGLFPLDQPPEDLREVEMWVQASWWYAENFT